LFNLLYVSTTLVLKVVYNVNFRHRGIPTKFWWAATDLTYSNAFGTGQSHKQIEALHKTLGDVVRIQPNHISFNSLEAVEAIHGIRTKARKGDVYRYVMRFESESPLTLFSETDKKRHGLLRRIANPLFSQSFLRELEPTMLRYCQLFLNGIRDEAKESGGVINLTKWIDHLAFDLSGVLSLGSDFKALETLKDNSLLHVITERWIQVSKVYGIPWLMPLKWKKSPSKSKLEGTAAFRNWIDAAIDKTLGKETGEKTLLNALLTASDPDTGMKLTQAETIFSSTGFIIAAADTTAGSLVFTIYHCLATPHAWTRLRHEIRSKFTSAEQITGQSTATLPFLDAVIHEGTRLHPAAPSNLVRETPSEGMIIAGHFIPGNTSVSTSVWTILHDERHFSNPHSFIPERWIEEERGHETCNKKAYLPFSTGLRNCIGRPLAVLEMRLVIALFVWHFDAELVKMEEPLYEDRLVARRGPMEIRVKPIQG